MIRERGVMGFKKLSFNYEGNPEEYIRIMQESEDFKMAKQLIEIEARHLQSEDLIFDCKTRKVQKIDYVSLEQENGDRYCGIGKMTNIHISYGLECNVADNFKPDYKVLILIDTDKIETILHCNIMQ